MQDIEKYRNSLINDEHKYILQTYKRLPIVIDKAEKCRIFDVNGDVYLDFLAGIAVNALGHSHPRIVDAVQEQLFRYMHVSNYFYQDIQIRLAEKLCDITGFSKVFYCNSGAEAAEGAIKLLRRWGWQNSKSEIIAFTGGFHGRTYGALSLMDKPKYKDTMGPFLPATQVLPLNDVQALMQSVNSNTAGIMLEFIQGEGGISEPTQEFVEILDELRRIHNFLLIADEVQCGVGRSGKFFAFEHFDIRPDLVIMAKGIGGGLPLGVLLVDESLEKIWETGMHGTTYGGNALACAAGLAVIEVLQEGLLEHVAHTGDYFNEKLKTVKSKHPSLVLEVRGRGLMKGLVLKFDASILLEELLKRKVIANATSGNVLRMVPPLIAGTTEIDEFVDALEDSLTTLEVSNLI